VRVAFERSERELGPGGRPEALRSKATWVHRL